MEIRDAFAKGPVLLDLKASDYRSVLDRTLDFMIERGHLSAAIRETVEAALLNREIAGTTAIGRGVAMPHAHLEALSKPIVGFIRLAKPLDLNAPDGEPIRFLFLVLGPKSQGGDRLQTLSKIAGLMGDDRFREAARSVRSGEEMLDAYDAYRERTDPKIVGVSDNPEAGDDLVRTGRFGGGIVRDIRRRFSAYRGDLRDGFHPKSIAATVFMFFACMAPAVAFGGLMDVMTDREIGVIEMVVATAVCGVVYALTSGQPLSIVAGTGPLLIFTGMLYDLCMRLEVPFLPVYTWVGLWLMVFLLAIALADGCAWIKHLTRFTDEIFAALIALLFIYEAIRDLVHVFSDHEVRYDTALLSLLLAGGTYYVAVSLGQIRSSRYLRPRIREFAADFGPTISIGVMTVVAAWVSQVKPGTVDLPRLPVPESFGTTSGRPWLVDPFEAPTWVWFAAMGPALLAAVLVFLNQNITLRLIGAADNNLKRPTGYHLSFAIVGLLIGACSLVGLPWLMASVIPSLNHLRSLATVEESVAPSGEIRQRVVAVRENRITPLAIHILIGLSLLIVSLLRQIPMSVLFGLFLYMGVSSLSRNSFFERLKLWLMDPALYPSTHYIRRVPFWTVHRYTLLQLVCLVVLWAVKSSSFGIVFPLFIALLVPVRVLAERHFTRRDLASLDTAESDPENAPPEIHTSAAPGQRLERPDVPDKVSPIILSSGDSASN